MTYSFMDLEQVSRKQLEEIIMKLREENKGQKEYITSQERTLAFFKIENDFFRTQTTKKGRSAMRESKMAIGRQSDIKKVMNQEIFPYYKFVNKDLIRSLGLGSIGLQIMIKLKVPPMEMPEFWAWNYELAAKAFTDYRSGALMQMKTAFKDCKKVIRI